MKHLGELCMDVLHRESLQRLIVDKLRDFWSPYCAEKPEAA